MVYDEVTARVYAGRGHRMILREIYQTHSKDGTAMTASSSIDPSEFLHEHLERASPDLLRQLMDGFLNTLLSAEADSVCGASDLHKGLTCDDAALKATPSALIGVPSRLS